MVAGLALMAAGGPTLARQRAVPARPAKAAPAAAKPVAVPVPAAPVDTTPRAHPVGNPSEWFPADAYPPEARNAGKEGRTQFMVKVDDKGRVLECDVVVSSGSVLLDNATCDQVVTHGRFTPARDANGRPVAGIWQSAMRWQLVATQPAVEESDVK